MLRGTELRVLRRVCRCGVMKTCRMCMCVVTPCHVATARCHFSFVLKVRSLCRKQFFSRALGLKVATVEQQQQQQPAGSRPLLQSSPGFHVITPYPIAHGDGWFHGPPPGPPATGPQTPGLMLHQPDFTSGQTSRFQGTPAVGTPGAGMGLTAASTGMLTNPLVGR